MSHFLEEAQTIQHALFRGQTRDYESLIPALYRQDLHLDIPRIERLLADSYFEIYDKIHDLTLKAKWGEPKSAQLGGLLGVHLLMIDDPWEQMDAWARLLKEHGESDGDPAYAEHAAFVREYRQRGYSLARLQHYGVPTSALDATYDPYTALWFATHGLQWTGERKGYYARSEEEGVVYVLKVPRGRVEDLRKVLVVAPGGDRGYRQQGALVLEATEEEPDLSRYVVKKIFASPKLFDEVDSARLGGLSQAYLFPSPSEDKFYAFLLQAKRDGKTGVAELGKWVMEYIAPPDGPGPGDIA